MKGNPGIKAANRHATEMLMKCEWYRKFIKSLCSSSSDIRSNENGKRGRYGND